MIALPGGRFLMGSDCHYPEERPARMNEIGPFRIDAAPVTVAAFAAFVDATGYQTVAERPPDPRAYPGADPAALEPGATVFRPPTDTTRRGWWAFVPGAQWRAPQGPGSTAAATHPVVHVAHTDAEAYAAWIGAALPTEAEWEYAARAGGSSEFAWGREFMPGGRHMANTWQGEFPFADRAEDGFAGTSPICSFPANVWGLFDMVGNVWEWTADRWAAAADMVAGCCTPTAARAIPRFVIKGGSHLCAPNYCRRYRPAARQPQAADTGTSHIGFRCARRELAIGGQLLALQSGAFHDLQGSSDAVRTLELSK